MLLADSGVARAADCDAVCLAGLAATYMDGLSRRGSSAGLPWADRVRYAENGVPMMVDDGIWATVTAHATAPLVIADPVTSNVVWMGEIEEHGQPAYLALRLAASGRRIAEAEEVIRRKEGRPPFADPQAFVVDARLTSPLPAGSRIPRARIEALVKSYYTAAAGGRVVALRFAADCARTENGVTATGGDPGPAQTAAACAAQFRSGSFGDVENVRGLSVPVVDEARGLAVAVGTRDYSGRPTTPSTTNGRPLAADARYPHSYAFIAVFKLERGSISRIQEVSSSVPYLMPTWKDQR
ncbi:MAG: hypothetical protein ACRYG4_25030 [Janthinobacterium lividum]